MAVRRLECSVGVVYETSVRRRALAHARSHTKTDDTRYESAGINEYARGHRTEPQRWPGAGAKTPVAVYV